MTPADPSVQSETWVDPLETGEPPATPEAPKPRFPLQMHKLQGGKLISGQILNADHEETAKTNGWLADADEARAAADGPRTVEARLEALEQWMDEEKQRKALP